MEKLGGNRLWRLGYISRYATRIASVLAPLARLTSARGPCVHGAATVRVNRSGDAECAALAAIVPMGVRVRERG